MSDPIPDEIAIACTPDEANDRMKQWSDPTDQPILYAPSVGVPPERMESNLAAMLDLSGTGNT